MYDETVEWTTQFMPKDKPRYLMGLEHLGFIENIAWCWYVWLCNAYKKCKKWGTVYKFWKIKYQKAEFKEDIKPIDESCSCYTCRNFTRAYLIIFWRAGWNNIF